MVKPKRKFRERSGEERKEESWTFEILTVSSNLVSLERREKWREAATIGLVL